MSIIAARVRYARASLALARVDLELKALTRITDRLRRFRP